MPEVGVPISTPHTLWGTSLRALEQPPPHPFIANWPEEPIVAGRQAPLWPWVGSVHALRCCHLNMSELESERRLHDSGRMPSLPALHCLSFFIMFIISVLPPHTPLLWCRSMPTIFCVTCQHSPSGQNTIATVPWAFSVFSSPPCFFPKHLFSVQILGVGIELSLTEPRRT